jgi:uncharacterized membrane protein
MSTARLETFSDGVFAIAATLLVLLFDVPKGGPLAHELLHQWPSYLAYAVSFVTIGIMWVNHHDVMAQIGHADRTFLFLTVGLLMCIAFVPYPTAIVAEFIRGGDREAAALFYGIALTVTAVFFNLLWRYAVSDNRLIAHDADPKLVLGITRSFRPGVPLYAGATLVALVSPVASVTLFAAISLFFVAANALLGRAPDEG